MFKLLNGFLEDNMDKQVKLITRNGYQMTCTISGYDEEVIRVRESGKRKMIFRAALSTIEEVNE